MKSQTHQQLIHSIFTETKLEFIPALCAFDVGAGAGAVAAAGAGVCEGAGGVSAVAADASAISAGTTGTEATEARVAFDAGAGFTAGLGAGFGAGLGVGCCTGRNKMSNTKAYHVKLVYILDCRISQEIFIKARTSTKFK